MQCQQIALLAAAGKGVGPGIAPHIAAVAPEPAELHIVAVLLAAVFEYKDELMLAAVERAHPGIVLDPDADVFELVIRLAASGQQLFDVPPIHADEMDGAVNAEGRKIAKSLA